MIKMIRLFLFLFFVLPNFANATEVGFRDLIIGENVQLTDYCRKFGDVYRCYDIDDLEFDIIQTPTKQIETFLPSDSYQSKITNDKLYSEELEYGDLNSLTQQRLRALIYRRENCDGLLAIDRDWSMFLVEDDRFDPLNKNIPFKSVSNSTLCEDVFSKVIDLPNNVNTVYFKDEFPKGFFLLTKPKLLKITIDVGPLYQTYLDYIIDDPNNPYNNLKNNLSKKYGIDWESTERDRNLFNEGEKDSLWSSFGDNQIFLEIRRVDYDMELFVHYLTKEGGKSFSEKISPKNANFSDF
ncbi:hypothetical protein N9M53_03390 [Alphaproteobacteria bacterium]|nr:hypothetical protein [Alphaproteobacteria bacterium]